MKHVSYGRSLAVSSGYCSCSGEIRYGISSISSSRRRSYNRHHPSSKQPCQGVQANQPVELIFRPIDFRRAGIVAVSDAALGNVQRSGASSGTPLEKVYSQAGYVIMIADEALVHGNCGSFNVLDSRSHRIPRVCRSTYSAETLSAEEAIDTAQLCRGFLASLCGKSLHGRNVDTAINSIAMTAVVDAKDVHDKGNSDTPSYGSQKSLAFTIAWLRSVLRRPNSCLKWTATSNMWVDALTKDMDLQHLRKILLSGSWSISTAPSS